LVDGPCFFAILVGLDLLAATFPAQDGINDALYQESST